MGKKSFTLIELIVVIAIIAILAAIIAPNAFKSIEKAKVAAAISDFKTYKTAALSLYADTGHWIMDGRLDDIKLVPDNNDLSVNYSSWAGWAGPYIERIKSRHPWNGWYIFSINADFNSNGRNELRLEMDNWCYLAPTDGGCPVPPDSRLRIDSSVDDGDITSGEVQRYPTQHDVLCWIMLWDYF